MTSTTAAFTIEDLLNLQSPTYTNSPTTNTQADKYAGKIVAANSAQTDVRGLMNELRASTYDTFVKPYQEASQRVSGDLMESVGRAMIDTVTLKPFRQALGFSHISSEQDIYLARSALFELKQRSDANGNNAIDANAQAQIIDRYAGTNTALRTALEHVFSSRHNTYTTNNTVDAIQTARNAAVSQAGRAGEYARTDVNRIALLSAWSEQTSQGVILASSVGAGAAIGAVTGGAIGAAIGAGVGLARYAYRRATYTGAAIVAGKTAKAVTKNKWGDTLEKGAQKAGSFGAMAFGSPLLAPVYMGVSVVSDWLKGRAQKEERALTQQLNLTSGQTLADRLNDLSPEQFAKLQSSRKWAKAGARLQNGLTAFIGGSAAANVAGIGFNATQNQIQPQTLPEKLYNQYSTGTHTDNNAQAQINSEYTPRAGVPYTYTEPVTAVASVGSDISDTLTSTTVVADPNPVVADPIPTTHFVTVDPLANINQAFTGGTIASTDANIVSITPVELDPVQDDPSLPIACSSKGLGSLLQAPANEAYTSARAYLLGTDDTASTLRSVSVPAQNLAQSDSPITTTDLTNNDPVPGPTLPGPEPNPEPQPVLLAYSGSTGASGTMTDVGDNPLAQAIRRAHNPNITPDNEAQLLALASTGTGGTQLAAADPAQATPVSQGLTAIGAGATADPIDPIARISAYDSNPNDLSRADLFKAERAGENPDDMLAARNHYVDNTLAMRDGKAGISRADLFKSEKIGDPDELYSLAKQRYAEDYVNNVIMGRDGDPNNLTRADIFKAQKAGDPQDALDIARERYSETYFKNVFMARDGNPNDLSRADIFKAKQAGELPEIIRFAERQYNLESVQNKVMGLDGDPTNLTRADLFKAEKAGLDDGIVEAARSQYNQDYIRENIMGLDGNDDDLSRADLFKAKKAGVDRDILNLAKAQYRADHDGRNALNEPWRGFGRSVIRLWQEQTQKYHGGDFDLKEPLNDDSLDGGKVQNLLRNVRNMGRSLYGTVHEKAHNDDGSVREDESHASRPGMLPHAFEAVKSAVTLHPVRAVKHATGIVTDGAVNFVGSTAGAACNLVEIAGKGAERVTDGVPVLQNVGDAANGLTETASHIGHAGLTSVVDTPRNIEDAIMPGKGWITIEDGKPKVDWSKSPGLNNFNHGSNHNEILTEPGICNDPKEAAGAIYGYEAPPAEAEGHARPIYELLWTAGTAVLGSELSEGKEEGHPPGRDGGPTGRAPARAGGPLR